VLKRLTNILLGGILVLLCAGHAAPGVRAAGRWPDERAVGPFVCHADFSLTEYTDLLDQMARLQEDLRLTLDVQPPREPIHLFLFEHKGTYRKYIQAYFPNVPFRRALFIKQRGPGMVFAYLNSDFGTDVRHESTHALLHAAMPMVPLWLDEGLAEYFEAPVEMRAYQHPHLAKVRWAARFGQAPKLEHLDNVRTLDLMGQNEYRDAWAWVHFMMHGPPAARTELVQYLGDIQAHAPPGSLIDRLRRRVPELEKQFVDHFRNWKRQ